MADADKVAQLEAQVAQLQAQADAQLAQLQAQADQAVKEANARAQAAQEAAAALEAEAQTVREELTARGAAGGGMDPTTMAQAFAAAFEAVGLGARRSESSSSGKKPGRSMPTFKGEDSAQYQLFERQFMAWCNFAKLTDEECKTQLYLAFDGTAAQIVDVFGPGSAVYRNNDFRGYATQIKSLFATRAQSEAAKSSFETTVQSASENVQQYAARKLAKFVTAYPDIDYATSEYLIRVFIKDLRSDKVREQVVLQGNKGKDFQGVVTAAADTEAGLEMLDNIKSSKGSVTHVKVTPAKAASAEEPMELGAILATLQPMMKESVDSGAVLAALQQQFRPRRDQNGRFIRGQQRRGGYQNQGNRDGCWECGDPNHFQRNCPKNSGQGGGNRGRGRGNGWRGGQRGRGSGSWRGLNSMGPADESNQGKVEETLGNAKTPEKGGSGEAKKGGEREPDF